ncbi:MAG: hypothetical protein A2X42_01980 [Candidatus Margulisbacteria bacterium GWF2_38_17]|nr:MAG: hypothetical protein A2X43_11155 [Candidatus Margulisbacteria bacterium GWD2_39_127]OGI02803.1 MAG: hypothetical protein A2X42_01980 [Candidatus Margulisbacteria bacterium GWF2_38_17]OGI09387.1 MAG: hypothetical protein A2X41_09395 [Candidatus Margulisbacteria bacterium GWE2_39_32]
MKDLAVGGQAVIEGVMMRGENIIATAIRNTQNKIVIEKRQYQSLSKRYKFLNLPVLRGFINLLEMLYLGFNILMYSAEVALGGSTEKKTSKWELTFSAAFSIGISVAMFIVLPAFIFDHLKSMVSNTLLLNVIEGVIRFSLFFSFLIFTMFFDDMKRVYQYHGAEHKVIHAYESGQGLDMDNIKKRTTLHPRCGTSFILVVMIISIIVFTFLGRPDFFHRVAYKIMLMPIISGIAYEIIKLNKKYDIFFLHWLVFPGLMLQKITTREPDEKQIEVALAALKEVI